MKRETEIAGDIVRELRTNHGCFVVNLAGSQFQMSGLPDIEIVKNRRHLWVECKIEDKPLKGCQESVRSQLAKQNVHVYVLRFIESRFWMIDEFYQIRFRTLKEGVAQLLNILLELETVFEKGVSSCVQMDTTSTPYTTETK